MVVALAALAGCEPEGAPGARKALLEEHVPRVKAILREDREKHWEAIQEAASRLAPGFQVEDPATREAQMRTALKRVQELPRGIAGLVVSPITFLAAVDAQGLVIARDVDDADDRMQGQDFAERFAPVRAALESGQPQRGLVTFETEENAEADVNRSSWLFVAPARRGGEVVGAVVAGIPLWRMAQRLSRQLRVELAQEIEQGLIVWALMLDGDQLVVPPDAPSEIAGELPSGAELRQRLGDGPGYTGELQAFQKWYGYAVVPVPSVGEGVALVVLRAGEGADE
tara:strand:- start:476 stop:1327 length:852 start_codon:yes stop_codon:yes gene_type:complete